jgi:uncharacterized protein
MNYKDFLKQFKQQVQLLNTDEQLSLAITICKKLHPYYISFFETYNWGNPIILSELISFLEKSAPSFVDRGTIKKKLEILDKITPDTDDFGDTISSCALNACIAVNETFLFLTQPDHSSIYNIGICLTDTVDSLLQDKEDLSDKEIENHPMMQEARNSLIEMSK